MIRFAGTWFRYGSSWVVRDLDLEVADGELLVVVGPTGSGKTTLLKMIDGLAPHFSGGELRGDVIVAGHSIRDTPPTELAGIVGYVGQDPAASFVTDRVEEEIAYAMENLGIEPAVMRRRVEEALDLMSLHELRDRRLTTLSGGQRQRVAIAAVLAAAPRILVLDEPTSALDPGAAEEVLSSLTRLVHDVGMTVVLAEHRLERVLPFADRVVLLDGHGGMVAGEPGAVMADSALAPPLIELGRLAGWSPLPIT
ncbi:MAG: ABC transporter ATP-binding protein, partial [Actinomycetes bacterium]